MFEHEAYPRFAPGERRRDPDPPSWQASLRDAVRDVRELARLLGLPDDEIAGRLDVDPEFPLLVPRGYLARMRPRDPDDPLLRQVLATVDERQVAPGYGIDPLGERPLADGGVLQKYSHRALLVTTGACPLHCRYCFRRHFPYTSQSASADDWQPALDALRQSGDIREVILSGGDPLTLSNARLGALLERLDGVDQLDTVRFHTRFPIAIPERVDRALLERLEATRLRVVVVVHTNHANEIDGSVAAALHSLKGVSDALLNQSVLLAGVNDSAEALVALSRRLFEAGTLPYYLHLLDRVAGAAHFDVPATRAVELLEQVQARLPGYLVPRLVRETPGAPSKLASGLPPLHALRDP